MFDHITLLLPAESKLPVIHGKARLLDDGTWEATYTRHELVTCLAIVNPPLPECERRLKAAWDAWDKINQRGEAGVKYMRQHPGDAKAKALLAELRQAEPAAWGEVEAAMAAYEARFDLESIMIDSLTEPGVVVERAL